MINTTRCTITKIIISLLLYRVFCLHEFHAARSPRDSTLESISRYSKRIGLGLCIFTSTQVLTNNPSVGAGVKNSVLSELHNNPSSFLWKRVTSDDSNIYAPDILSSDIFYPIWLDGKWNLTSTFRDVLAPLGQEAFGGQAVFNAVRNDLNQSLSYISKFRPTSNGNSFILSNYLLRLTSIEHFPI